MAAFMTVDFQLDRPLDKARIVVAMSGGVDSSVVAALAARTGAEVIGITLQLYDDGAAVQRTGSCCACQDIYDARTVADRLGIAHYVFDYESRFRDSVIERFADEYMKGRTPIPCISCNQGVKFTDLLSLARDLGADCLATGHYVRRVVGPNGAELHRAADPARDQSYFLFATTQEQLDYRSEEHTSELQSLMRSSYAVFCLKKKKTSRRIISSNYVAPSMHCYDV